MATAKKSPTSKIDAALKAKAAQAKSTEADAGGHQYQAGWKPPKTLAAGADAMFKLREQRLKLQKEVDALEAQEGDLKHYLISQLPAHDASGVAGKLCRVTLKKAEVPKADDWSQTYASIVSDYSSHLRKKDGLQDTAFAILNRALSKSAIGELWDSGKAVPGVSKFTTTSLSINKL